MATHSLHCPSSPSDASDMPPPSDDSPLRKRTPSEKPPSSRDTPVNPAQSPSHGVPNASTRTSKLLVAIISLTLTSYFAYNKLGNIGQPTSLSEPYALCSREGAHIYTLDAKNPRVQCLVVNGSKFTLSGSLSEQLDRPSS